MLKKFITSGFKLFEKSVELNMETSKGKNTVDIFDYHILKSSILYGANNSGKSNFIDALKTMKSLFMEGNLKEFPLYECRNFFSDTLPISFEVEFILKTYTYVYGIRVLDEDNLNEYLMIDGKEAFSKGEDNKKNLDKRFFKEEVYQSTYEYLNNNELFISKALSYSNKIENEHVSNINIFFKKLRFFDNNSSGQFIDLIIECLENDEKKERYNSLISKADIAIQSKELTNQIGVPNFNEEEFLKAIKQDQKIEKEELDNLLKMLRIKSIYKQGEKTVKVPSNFFDSIGTNKFSNLLLMILHTIEHDEVLLIDEIDNSLHYRLTRELIKIMNSSINKRAQFIMSAHDIKLLTPLLFRKEQINFVDRTDEDVEIFSLGDFEDVRNDSSFENLYMKNKVGALPNPDLEEVIAKWEKLIQEEGQEG